MNNIQVTPLSVDTLLAKARDLSSVSITDSEAIEPLSQLVDSLNVDGDLSAPGSAALQRILVHTLSNRLRMLRDLAAHPEILEQQLKAPTIILGMPRTGSTKLQNILAASGDFNRMTFWMSRNPSAMHAEPEESVRLRIAEASSFIKWFDSQSPRMKSIHAMNLHGTEEEIYVLTQSLYTFGFKGYAAVHGYIEWLMTQDLKTPLSYLRDTLKYLQWQGLGDPKKPWILKCPMHLGMEREILNVFPGANLVMTHRNLTSVVPSSVSLFNAYREPFSESRYTASEMIADLAAQMALHMNNRAELADLSITDVHYQDLLSTWSDPIADIYEAGGLQLTESSLDNMKSWESSNPQKKHDYAGQQFELNEQVIESSFDQYLKLFDGKYLTA